MVKNSLTIQEQGPNRMVDLNTVQFRILMVTVLEIQIPEPFKNWTNLCPIIKRPKSAQPFKKTGPVFRPQYVFKSLGQSGFKMNMVRNIALRPFYHSKARQICPVFRHYRTI